MTTVLTQSFNVNAKNGGSRTFGPWNVPDAVDTVRASFTSWPQSATTLTVVVEMSLDGGATWREIARLSGAGTTTYKGQTGAWLQCEGLWQMCQCGQVYIPGHPANAQLLIHSDHAFQDISALPDLSTITFHVPDVNRDTSLPQRQGRVTVTINGPITTTVTVDVN